MRTRSCAWLVALIVSVLALASPVCADTEICGDLDGSGSLVASDALLLLRKAVGQDLVIECPAVCPSSTTTTTTSTTTTSPTTSTTMSASCDALAQDCPDAADSCFPLLNDETTACAPSAAPGTQGDECQFANSCAEGYGCTLLNEAQTGLVCAFLCDALGGGGPTCADGPGAAFACIAINDYYLDVDGFPPDLGMCVPPEM